MSELIDPHEPLHLEAANGTDMPHVGWVEIPFTLTASDSELLIPVLVLKGCQQQCPIIGFNVIEHLVSESMKDGTNSVEKDKLLFFFFFFFFFFPCPVQHHGSRIVI